MLVLRTGPSRADALDREIRAAMDREGLPGLTLAVVRHGRIVRLGAYGYGNLEWKAKATPDTRFEIASMSKMFTGAAARIMIDEGKLSPEDPISNYFEHLPDAWKGMRVRHLITMSTGLPEDWGSDLIPYDADVTTAYDDASMMKAFTGLKRQAPVGAEFHYSGAGYVMLGFIVSKLSGVPLGRFIEEHLFGPADMKQTSLVDNWAIVPERAQGYRKADGNILKGWYLGQYLHARPDVGIMSTARDMAKWIIALEQGKVVKDPQKLWDGATADSGRPLDYAYGWLTESLLGHRRQIHGGRYRTGFRSVIERLPDDDLTVIVLANCDSAAVDAYALKVIRTYLRDLPDPERESKMPDGNPAETAKMIDALKGILNRKLDENVMTPDALEPVSRAEAAERLKSFKSFSYAGRHTLGDRSFVMHGHRLVDFEILKLEGDADSSFYLAFYRDERGKIAYIAPAM